MFAAFLTTILFSISAMCGHRSAKLIGGTEANFWRIAFATVFLSLWATTAGQGLAGAAFPVFLVSGIVGIGLGDVAFFQTLPRLGPRLTLLLVQCLTAPFGALIERVWLGSTLKPAQIVFGFTILVGVGIALAPGRLKLSRREWTIGIFTGVVAALGGAAGAVLSRKAYQIVHAGGEHIDGLTAGFQRVLGGLFLAGICLLFVKRKQFWNRPHANKESGAELSRTKWRRVWFWIVLNSLAGQTLGVSCMLWALETTPAGVVLSIISATPIVVMPLAFVFEGERPTPHSIIGGAVAVAGVIALTLSR